MEFDDGNRRFTIGNDPYYVHVSGQQLVEWCPLCFAQTGEKVGVGPVKVSQSGGNRYQPCVSGNHGIFFPRLPTAVEIENGLEPPVLPILTNRGVIPGGKQRCSAPGCTRAKGSKKCSTSRCPSCCTDAAVQERENGRDGRILCTAHKKQIDLAIDKLEQEQAEIGLASQQAVYRSQQTRASSAENSRPASPNLAPRSPSPFQFDNNTPAPQTSPSPSPPPFLPPTPPALPAPTSAPAVTALDKGKGKALRTVPLAMPLNVDFTYSTPDEDTRMKVATQRAQRQTGIISNAVPGPSTTRKSVIATGSSASRQPSSGSQRGSFTQSSMVPHKRKSESQIGPSKMKSAKTKSARSVSSKGVAVKGPEDFPENPNPERALLAPTRPIIKDHVGDSFLCRLTFGEVARGMDSMRLLCTIRGMDTRTAFSKIFTGADAIYKPTTFRRHREIYFWTQPETLRVWKEREGGRLWKEFYVMRSTGGAESQIDSWNATKEELETRRLKKKRAQMERKNAKAALFAHRRASRTKGIVKVEDVDDYESWDDDELESTAEVSQKDDSDNDNDDNDNEDEGEDEETDKEQSVKMEEEDVFLPQAPLTSNNATTGSISVPENVRSNVIELLDDGYMLNGVFNFYDSDTN